MSSTLVFRLPHLTGPSDFGRPLPRWAWTTVGALSIPLWATWPTLAVTAGVMPPFQLLTIAFAVAWVALTLLDNTTREQTRTSWSQIAATLACSLGLLGTNALFILSTAYIPAAQANLISYLWPVMVVFFAALLRLLSLQWQHVVGVAVGFAGATVAIGAEDAVFSWTGILLAGLSGASWALFSVFRLWQGSTARNVLANGCMVSAALSLLLHLCLEETAAPGLVSLAAAVAIGIAPLALANLAWDNGIRRGDSRSLAVMAYATPLAAAAILIVFGHATLTFNLVLGGLLIVGAGVLSTARVSGRAG